MKLVGIGNALLVFKFCYCSVKSLAKLHSGLEFYFSHMACITCFEKTYLDERTELEP